MVIKKSVTESFADSNGKEFLAGDLIVYSTSAGESVGIYKGIEKGMLRIGNVLNNETISVRPKSIIKCAHEEVLRIGKED